MAVQATDETQVHKTQEHEPQEQAAAPAEDASAGSNETTRSTSMDAGVGEVREPLDALRPGQTLLTAAEAVERMAERRRSKRGCYAMFSSYLGGVVNDPTVTWCIAVTACSTPARW